MKTPGTKVLVGVGVRVWVAVGRVPVIVGVRVGVAVMVIVPVGVTVGDGDGDLLRSHSRSKGQGAGRGSSIIRTSTGRDARDIVVNRDRIPRNRWCQQHREGHRADVLIGGDVCDGDRGRFVIDNLGLAGAVCDGDRIDIIAGGQRDVGEQDIEDLVGLDFGVIVDGDLNGLGLSVGAGEGEAVCVMIECDGGANNALQRQPGCAT